jgi:hypothetical protein
VPCFIPASRIFLNPSYVSLFRRNVKESESAIIFGTTNYSSDAVPTSSLGKFASPSPQAAENDVAFHSQI